MVGFNTQALAKNRTRHWFIRNRTNRIDGFMIRITRLSTGL